MAESVGCQVETFYDCGVAGLHRLLGVIDRVRACHVCICVAGMDAALPSVLAGLVDAPGTQEKGWASSHWVRSKS